MASRKITLPKDTLSLSATLTDKLLRKGSGDAALMYLYLLRHDGFYDPEEACRTLKWPREQVDGAMVLLGELGIQTGEPDSIFDAPAPKKENAPEYSTWDITHADAEFQMLLEEIERLLDRQLALVDLKRLMELYDHVGLPSEVIVMLTSMKCDEYQEKYGEGRRPKSLAGVVSAAYKWKADGIDTLDAATAYLAKRQYFRSQEGVLLNAVQIRGRKATPTERDYLMKWAEWGFSPEAVAVAYDRTVVGTGKMTWSYCNKILLRWHNENRHTLEEIQAAQSPRSHLPRGRSALQIAQTPTPQEEADQARRIEENQRRLQELLKPYEDGSQT